MSKIDLRPTGDRILAAAPDKEREHIQGGLIVPTSAASPLVEVVVVAIGPGRMLESGTVVSPEVQAGDWVLINRHSGQPVERDGGEFRLLAPHEILAVVVD